MGPREDTMPRLAIDDAALEYVERGSGEPILLVHAGVFSDWFTPLRSRHELDDLRVIQVRRAGYSAARPPNHLTFGDHARHCAALLRHLGLETVHYVGHSSSC